MGASKTIDLVSSKFGILVLENVGGIKPDIVATPMEDFQELAQFLFGELEDDIAEEHNWRDPTPEDTAELRKRAEPYIAGLPNETEARRILEEYIARLLSVTAECK